MENKLTPFEKALYQMLLDAPDGLTHQDILSLELPTTRVSNQNNKCAVHIAGLRKKLGIEIENIRGIGYKIVKN